MTNKVKFTLTRLPIDRCVNNEGQIPEVPANPRTLGKKEFERLKKKLLELDFTAARPLIAYPQGGQYVVFCGNQRLRALREIGETEINAAIVPEGMSAEELRKILLADNVSDGEWDTDMFANEEFSAEEAEWAGVDEAIWNTDGVEKKETQEDDFDEDTDKVETVCKDGDLWQLGQHRLMCGDSTKPDDVAALLDGNRAAILMTDPPYGINAEKMTLGTGKRDFHRGDWDSERPDISLAIANADKHCIWGGNYFADRLPVTNDWLCWHKKNDGLSFSEFELAWTDFGKNCRILSHHWGSEKKLHPTMKPIAVIAWALDISKTQGSVLDLFGGSGSTLIACEQLNRKCYMMELDPHYCDVIIARWEKLTGQKACKL